MMTSKKNQMKTGIVWLIVFPIVTYIAYTSFPISEIDWLYVFLLCLIMCMMMLLPIQIGEISITLERWITLAIFLQYGMFTEFVFSQIAMLILLFSVKTSLPISHKFFMNSIIFSITSLVSAWSFTFLGGEIYSTNFAHVVQYGFLYAAIYSFVNSVLLKFYFKLNGQSFSLFSKGAVWDYLSTLVMVPTSVALYFLNQYIGNKSILLIGIPFLILLLATRRFNDSNTRQNQLESAAHIGRELANQLHFDEVLRVYLRKLSDIISFESGYVVDLRSEKALIPLMSIEHGEIHQQVKNIVFTRDKEENDGLSLQETKIYMNTKEITSLKNITFKEQTESVMSIPIIRDERTEGFLLLRSAQKNAFKKEDIQILEILTSYFAVSLEKATHFEKTLQLSEKCGLTKLHNYRYLDRKIDTLVTRYDAGEVKEIAVIILDIDYFKKVNDTYGHENGNVVLVKLAKILQGYQKPHDILARYDGEEFVFVFPNCAKDEAVTTAEAIRKDVEQTVFTITSDLDKSQPSIPLQITISLGVATLPQDASTASQLIRNADRALYIGGKQAGRNKVGVFGRFTFSEKART